MFLFCQTMFLLLYSLRPFCSSSIDSFSTKEFLFLFPLMLLFFAQPNNVPSTFNFQAVLFLFISLFHSQHKCSYFNIIKGYYFVLLFVHQFFVPFSCMKVPFLSNNVPSTIKFHAILFYFNHSQHKCSYF